jgi:5-methylcytosine-specific restriction endonuclease McrA
MSQELHDKLRYAQELLSHQVPQGDVAEVIECALDHLIPQLERRKFAATARPRHSHQRPTTNPRQIPAPIKRAVWERDGGQCTFVSETGRRCPARTLLEFDHVDPVARGGRATVERMRLRCRAHNQYAAERTFGIEFIRHKREAAQRDATAAARAKALARAQVASEKAAEVIPWLRALGIRADEARHAAALCEAIPDAPLEQRVRLALTRFGPRTSRLAETRQRAPGA